MHRGLSLEKTNESNNIISVISFNLQKTIPINRKFDYPQRRAVIKKHIFKHLQQRIIMASQTKIYRFEAKKPAVN